MHPNSALDYSITAPTSRRKPATSSKSSHSGVSAGGFWQLLLTVDLNVVDGGLASTGSSVVPVLYRELTKLSS